MEWDLPPKKMIKADEGVNWHAPMIQFRKISNDGRRETILWGQGVAPAPPWRGQRADWVRPIMDDEPAVVGVVLRVVTVTKRHRCGISRRAGHVTPGGGRYVEVGEAYSCPAIRSADAAAWRDHLRQLQVKVIPVDPDEGDWMFEFLSGACNGEMMCT